MKGKLCIYRGILSTFLICLWSVQSYASDVIKNAENIDEIKFTIMRRVLKPASFLAHYLGYGWVGGCDSEDVGDGYQIGESTTWVPDKSYGCSGFRSNDRTTIQLDNWSYSIKDIQFSDPITKTIGMKSISKSLLDNWDSEEESELKCGRRVGVMTQITHIKETTFNWQREHGVEKSIGIGVFGGINFEYNFSFGGEEKKGDTEKQETTYWDIIEMSTTLPPYSRRNCHVQVDEIQSTINYEATIQVGFSLKFDGFLRWGNGKTPESNYHYDYYGSSARITFPYTFGNEKYSAAEQLVHEMENKLYPWDWGRLLDEHGEGVRWSVKQLSDERQFTFLIKGRIERISGENIRICFDPIKYRYPVTK